RTEDLAAAWRRLGLSRLSLEIIELPDRRLNRAALQLAADELADGGTEVSVLLPRLQHNRVWHRLLHDRTADSIAQAPTHLPHCNVTIVPYHLRGAGRSTAAVPVIAGAGNRSASNGNGTASEAIDLGVAPPDNYVGLDHVPTRQQVTVVGRVHSVRVQPWGSA